MLYPIGIQNFEKIRTGGFVYVDKTAQIYKLAATGSYYIKGYDSRFNAYNLDYPNEEVAAGFLHSLSQLYAPALIGDEFSVYSFVDDIERGDVDSFMTRFTSFLSGNDYEIQGDLELYRPIMAG